MCSSDWDLKGETVPALSNAGASLFQVVELGVGAGESAGVVKTLMGCWNQEAVMVTLWQLPSEELHHLPLTFVRCFLPFAHHLTF